MNNQKQVNRNRITLKTIEHGQTKGPTINIQTRWKCRYTEQKKNNVNRETLALKAIINQTRSIGNEFLVINIKVQNRRVRHRAVGCAQRRVVLGASRLQDKTNINKRKKVKKKHERTPTTTLFIPVEWKWKLNKQQHWEEAGKKNQTRLIFLLIYS